MALDKAIQSGKEKRKPYRRSKRFVRSCRNHGGCPWCEGNRRFKFRDRHPFAVEEMLKQLESPEKEKRILSFGKA